MLLTAMLMILHVVCIALYSETTAAGGFVLLTVIIMVVSVICRWFLAFLAHRKLLKVILPYDFHVNIRVIHTSRYIYIVPKS